MLAISQSSGISPVDKDWLKIDVRTGDISSLDSLRMRGDISSGLTDFQMWLPQYWASVIGSLLAWEMDHYFL